MDDSEIISSNDSQAPLLSQALTNDTIDEPYDTQFFEAGKEQESPPSPKKCRTPPRFLSESQALIRSPSPLPCGEDDTQDDTQEDYFDTQWFTAGRSQRARSPTKSPRKRLTRRESISHMKEPSSPSSMSMMDSQDTSLASLPPSTVCPSEPISQRTDTGPDTGSQSQSSLSSTQQSLPDFVREFHGMFDNEEDDEGMGISPPKFP
jgi:hypothetical protein